MSKTIIIILLLILITTILYKYDTVIIKKYNITEIFQSTEYKYDTIIINKDNITEIYSYGFYGTSCYLLDYFFVTRKPEPDKNLFFAITDIIKKSNYSIIIKHKANYISKMIFKNDNNKFTLTTIIMNNGDSVVYIITKINDYKYIFRTPTELILYLENKIMYNI